MTDREQIEDLKRQLEDAHDRLFSALRSLSILKSEKEEADEGRAALWQISRYLWRALPDDSEFRWQAVKVSDAANPPLYNIARRRISAIRNPGAGQYGDWERYEVVGGSCTREVADAIVKRLREQENADDVFSTCPECGQ